MNLPPQLLDVHYDAGQQTLFTPTQTCTDHSDQLPEQPEWLSKGHCFYCNAPISLDAGHPLLADVDHFIPLVANNMMPCEPQWRLEPGTGLPEL